MGFEPAISDFRSRQLYSLQLLKIKYVFNLERLVDRGSETQLLVTENVE